MGSDGSFTSWKKLCEDGKLDVVLHALDHNKDARFSVLTDIFYCLLQGCIKTRNLEAGRRVYCQIVRNRLESNAYLGSHLICMFAACKSLLEANHVFKRLPKPNVFTWNEIILAHIKHGRAEQAIKLYNRMQFSSVKPDGHILVTVLKACASTKALKQGKLIHGHIIEFAADPDLFVWTTLIDMYAKCGCVKDARRVFDRLRRRNVVTWSAMITGYVEHGHGEEAFRLYKKMQLEGLDPDLVTLVSTLKACSSIAALNEGKLIHAQVIESGFVLDALLGNSLLDMYAKCGSHAEACSVFSILRKRDVVTWSAMIEANAEHRDHVLALGYFGLMLQEGLRPDEAAFICLLSACSQLGLVEDGCHHFNSIAEKYGEYCGLEIPSWSLQKPRQCGVGEAVL